MKILVVDHVSLPVLMAEEMLVVAGHDVTWPARNFDEAIEQATVHGADVAIVNIDLDAPADGPIVSKALQESLGIPCILVCDAACRALDFQEAAVAVLYRPFQLHELCQSVELVAAIAEGRHTEDLPWPAPLVIFDRAFPAIPQPKRA